uniref:Uncharacterized protein n=1 Tax=Arundo donax TaxID=35708 RepID=A0A0A9AP60_ARUDO
MHRKKTQESSCSKQPNTFWSARVPSSFLEFH